MKKKIATLIAAVVLVVICMFAYQIAYPEWLVSRFLSQHPASELRKYALSLNVGGRVDEDALSDRGRWPNGFADFGVIEIMSYIDGILVILHSNDKKRCGVFISMETEGDLVPYDGSGISFKAVGDSVFTFEEKLRDEF